MTPAEAITALGRAVDAAAARTTGGQVLAGSSDFDLNPDIRLPEGRVLRPAGVLVAVDTSGPRAELILTKRSSGLKHHPGQIAFAGGKQEPGDADVTAAALREAHEEIGLPPDQVRLLGALPSHETVTGFRMTPVIGLIETPFDPLPEAGEVEAVFRVPLDHVANPANFRIESRRWQGRLRYYYAVPYGPWYIWGATARILRGMAQAMRDDA